MLQIVQLPKREDFETVEEYFTAYEAWRTSHTMMDCVPFLKDETLVVIPADLYQEAMAAVRSEVASKLEDHEAVIDIAQKIDELFFPIYAELLPIVKQYMDDPTPLLKPLQKILAKMTFGKLNAENVIEVMPDDIKVVYDKISKLDYKTFPSGKVKILVDRNRTSFAKLSQITTEYELTTFLETQKLEIGENKFDASECIEDAPIVTMIDAPKEQNLLNTAENNSI